MTDYRSCAVCARTNDDVKRFIRHHVLYDPEITVDLCWQCHSWLHGSAKIFHHPFIKRYGKDIGPWHFCAQVCLAYERATNEYLDTGKKRVYGKRERRAK